MSISLNPEDLQVTSFATVGSQTGTTALIAPGGDSFPAVCTCIGICQPTADLYCSGGCPPVFTIQKAEPISVAQPVQAGY